MKIFISIAAVLAWLIGAMLLFMPAEFYSPLGIALDPKLSTIAQAHGATLFGLGVVNWLARGAEGKGLIAVLAGNFVVQVLSLLVALRTMTLGAGMGIAPALVIHIVLGSLFAFFWLRARHS